MAARRPTVVGRDVAISRPSKRAIDPKLSTGNLRTIIVRDVSGRSNCGKGAFLFRRSIVNERLA